MPPRDIEHSENLPEQSNEVEDLTSRINDIREQIMGLQRELAQLEQRQQEFGDSAPSTTPASGQGNGQLEAPEGHSIQWPLPRIELFLLGLLVLAALVIRVYRLGSFPDTVLADEADNAQSAVQIIYGNPPENGFFGFDWTPQPAFSVYKEALFIALFGFNIMALRLPSAIISALALIPFYLLLRRQLTVLASLLASILLATDVWYLNFSRSGWNNIDICFYMLMAMLFLMWAMDATVTNSHPPSSRWKYFAAAGIFCALGLYGYPSGRAITLAVIAFLPIALLFYRQHYKMLLLGFAVLFVIEAMLFAPMGIYIAKKWESFNRRTNVILVLNSPEYKASPVGTLLQQLNKNIRAPWDGRVNNTPQYTPAREPQLERFTGFLVLIGMVLTFLLAGFRGRSETWLWWLMLLSGWTLTQILTSNTPNGARGVGYMPAFIFFAGVSLHVLQQVIGNVLSKKIPYPDYATKYLAFAVLTGIILWIGYLNVVHYVNWQNDPKTRETRYLYVTAREFQDWSARIMELNTNQFQTMNVGQWRELHPIENKGNPYIISP